MRHARGLPLAVSALARGVTVAPRGGSLVLSPRAPHTGRPCLGGAARRAVPLPAVALAVDRREVSAARTHHQPVRLVLCEGGATGGLAIAGRHGTKSTPRLERDMLLAAYDDHSQRLLAESRRLQRAVHSCTSPEATTQQFLVGPRGLLPTPR